MIQKHWKTGQSHSFLWRSFGLAGREQIQSHAVFFYKTAERIGMFSHLTRKSVCGKTPTCSMFATPMKFLHLRPLTCCLYKKMLYWVRTGNQEDRCLITSQWAVRSHPLAMTGRWTHIVEKCHYEINPRVPLNKIVTGGNTTWNKTKLCETIFRKTTNLIK